MRLAFCAAALVALVCLLIRADRLGMAGDYIDPFSHIGAQDEALYAHSAIHMAQSGGWLTPMFMGRYGLYKPPFLAASAGISARILGVSRFTLRLPVALIASLAVGLVFLWAAELNGWQAGVCAVGLLISNHLWHTLAGLCLTDGLLTAFYVAALYCLFADPWLESRWALWGYSGAIAASILTKSIAGFLPLAVLGLYWICAPPKYKPRFWRVVTAGSLALALAAPWFLYQMTVHRVWFWTEHINVEILGFGLAAPPQTSQENQFVFYLTRAALLDPVLLAAFAASVPTLVRELRKRSPASVLLALGIALPAIAAMVWQYRNVSYLLPLIPIMAILATAYNPLSSGAAAKWMMATVALAFLIKAASPGASWGLPFQDATRVAVAPLLSDYCERGRGNELIVVDAPDELYASLLPLPKVRYLLQGTPPVHGQYGLDFSSMGIILSETQFGNLPSLMPGFQQRLHAWGLESTEPVGTVIFVQSQAGIASTVSAHPDSDFLLPERYRPAVSDSSHDSVKVSPEYFLMLSHHPLPGAPAGWTCRL